MAEPGRAPGPAAPAVQRWRRPGVRVRLTLLATTALALALLVAAAVLGVAVRAALLGALDDAARQRAADVAARVEAGTVPDPLPVTGAAVVQVVQGGRVLASSPGGDRLAPLVGSAAVAEAAAGAAVDVDGSRFGSPEPFRVVGVPAGPAGTTVLVATSTAELDRALSVLRRVALLGGPLLLLATAVLAWRVSGSALRPVEALRLGAERVAAAPARAPGAGREALPVPPSEDEVARLARTLNAMLARLDAASDRQRAFLGDAAHELRGPLGSLRTQLEVAAAHPGGVDWPDLVRGALTDVERLSALVADLLVLARLDEAPVVRRPVDLAEVVRAAVAAGDWRVPVEVDAPPGVLVTGDARALARVVGNLVGNAARHARSRVVVRLTPAEPHGDGAGAGRGEVPGGVRGGDHAAAAGAVLDVVDDGPGIPAADRERVFDRFTRLDAARDRDAGGTGLGLAIVRAAVTQHAGSVQVLDGDAGGARLRVRLPGAPRSGAP